MQVATAPFTTLKYHILSEGWDQRPHKLGCDLMQCYVKSLK